RVVATATDEYRDITYPYCIGGTDCFACVQAESPRWSPSGRFIVYRERLEGRPNPDLATVVYDAESERSRRFESLCPKDSRDCYPPASWWAPGADLMLVPARWSQADGLTVGVYNATSDLVTTPFTPTRSRALSLRTPSTAAAFGALFDVVTGRE